MKRIVWILLVCALVPLAAGADDDDEGRYGQWVSGAGRPVTPNPRWQTECGSCHIAYAPGLLPADSWRRIMSGLDKHFGTDASLTAQEKDEITGFLVGHAATRTSESAPALRITQTGWFKDKHASHEVPPSVWNRPAVKSRSNCGACHADAAKGNFEERGVTLPR